MTHLRHRFFPQKNHKTEVVLPLKAQRVLQSICSLRVQMCVQGLQAAQLKGLSDTAAALTHSGKQIKMCCACSNSVCVHVCRHSKQGHGFPVVFP